MHSPHLLQRLRTDNVYRYFDTTPLALLSGIVSDQGIYTPEALRLLLQPQKLSPALQRLASGRAASNH